jgi:hypothetical protein
MIRFPVMDPSEFANGPAVSGLLTQEEILNCMLTKFSQTPRDPPLFSPMKRTPKKFFNRLDCRCKPGKLPCLFCKDGDGVSSENGVSPLTTTTTSVLAFSYNPVPNSLYCPCRTRNYCPTRRVK